MSDKDMPQSADHRYQAPTMRDMAQDVARGLPKLAVMAVFAAVAFAALWLVGYGTGDSALTTLLRDSVSPIVFGGAALCALVVALRRNPRDVGFDASVDITRARTHAFGMLLIACVLGGLSIYTYLNA